MHLPCTCHRYFKDNCFQLPGQSWLGPVSLGEKGCNSVMCKHSYGFLNINWFITILFFLSTWGLINLVGMYIHCNLVWYADSGMSYVSIFIENCTNWFCYNERHWSTKPSAHQCMWLYLCAVSWFMLAISLVPIFQTGLGMRLACHAHCFVPAYAKFVHEFLTLFHRPCATYL